MADIPAHILDAHSGDPIKRVAATIHRINNHWWNRRIRPAAADLRALLDAAEREAAARKRVEELDAFGDRAREIVAWWDTGILPRGEISSRADEEAAPWHTSDGYSPRHAEQELITELVRFAALSPRTEQEQGDG